MKYNCEKYGFVGEKWVSGVTYEGIDEHHNPPTFMMKRWEGEIINLCRRCHKELHDIILKIIFKHSNLFKPNKSEHWTWIKVIPNKRQEYISEVIKSTREWVDGNSKTIAG